MATARTTRKSPRPPLALALPRVPADEVSPESSNVDGRLTVETVPRWAGPPVRLSCLIVCRDYALAHDEPVSATFELPDYEHREPEPYEVRLPVELDSAEQLCEAMLACVREAKRLGFAGPERARESA